MADASASELAGPSKVDFHDEVRLAEAKFHQGIQAIKVLTMLLFEPSSRAQPLHTGFDLLHCCCSIRYAECKFIVQANDLDQAVELFGQVLQTRCQQFGGRRELSDARCCLLRFSVQFSWPCRC